MKSDPRAPTPRTDAAICKTVHTPNVWGFKEHDRVEQFVSADFARQLERELSQARAVAIAECAAKLRSLVADSQEQCGYGSGIKFGLESALMAIESLSPPAAGVVVPREPTPEMLLAASSLHRKWEETPEGFPSGYWQAIYKAMLSARPK